MAWGENLPRKTAEVATGAGVFIEGVNKEDKQEISESKKEISKTEEKVSESAENFPKPDVKPVSEASSAAENIQQPKEVAKSKAVDPTESVTESSIQKTQKGAAK